MDEEITKKDKLTKMNIEMKNLYTGESKIVSIEKAVRTIGGGTNKYDSVIKDGLENGKKFSVTLQYQVEFKKEKINIPKIVKRRN